MIRRPLTCLLSACMFVVLTANVTAQSDPLLGEWEHPSNADELFFHGNGIGLEIYSGTNTWMAYSTASTNITFNRGGGDTETFSYTVTTSALTLTNAAGQSVTWTKAATSPGACARNCYQLEGAKALFEKDNEPGLRPTIAELLKYLIALPSCPGSGVYTTAKAGSPPSCSKCGPAP